MEKKIEKFFESRPEAFELFNVVCNFIETLGQIKKDVTGTQISFGTKRKFAWVWLPQMWIKKQPENSIVLTIALHRQIVDKRIKDSREPYPKRFVHHIVIEKKDQIDEKIKDWLQEAYRLSK